MTIDEFARWCAFFASQLKSDDVGFLTEWFDDLKDHSLQDAKDAVLYCVRTASKFDKGGPMYIPKILAFLEEAERRRAKDRRYDYAGETVERGDDWKNSPLRKELLSRIKKQIRKRKAGAA